jgi:hypothetical protein
VSSEVEQYGFRAGTITQFFFITMQTLEETVSIYGKFWMDSGCVITGQENIKLEAVNHFKDLYKEHISPSPLEQVRVVALFTKMFTEAEAESLYASIELDELKKVISKFKTDKSPGPDGWTIEFFSHFFYLVGRTFWIWLKKLD